MLYYWNIYFCAFKKTCNMKKVSAFLFFIFLYGIVILLTGSSMNTDNSSGAPAGNTNSPGDGQNCTHCMGGTAVPVVGWITSDVPADGYKNDSTYHITVTATGTGNKGFEVSPQTLTGNLIGTLFAGTGSKLVGSGKYVTHNAAKSANPATWVFTWKAPSTGSENITFYGSIAVTKLQTKTTTLTITKNTVGLDEKKMIEARIYPVPSSGNFTLEMEHASAGNVSVDLTDLSGRLIQRLSEGMMDAGHLSLPFSVNQPTGIYVVTVAAGDQVAAKKLVISR
jgi:hypothetical protein